MNADGRRIYREAGHLTNHFEGIPEDKLAKLRAGSDADPHCLANSAVSIITVSATQGLENRLIQPEPALLANTGAVQRRELAGGILNYYHRA